LSQLTRLELRYLDWAYDNDDFERALQQLLAQPLPLRKLHIDINSQELPVLDLGRLQQLQEFITLDLLPQGSVLPTQLQRLQLGQCQPSLHLAAVMPLQQLTALELEPYPYDALSSEHKWLLQLTQLTALQQLRLSYLRPDIAAATASAWGKLPQLCELHYDEPGRATTEQEAAAIIAGLAAATSLTTLSLIVGVGWVSDDAADQLSAAVTAAGYTGEMPGVPINACASLARLTRLEHLHFSCSSLQQAEGARKSTRATPALVPGDAAALTALTGLTELFFAYDDACVSDAAALALASHLTQLRVLSLWHCSLGSMLCLERIVQLPHLSRLQLGACAAWEGLTQQLLMLLTGLCGHARRLCLQELGSPVNDEVTDAAVSAFQIALGAVTRQDWQFQRFRTTHGGLLRCSSTLTAA
jgi:hypothetical protein